PAVRAVPGRGTRFRATSRGLREDLDLGHLAHLELPFPALIAGHEPDIAMQPVDGTPRVSTTVHPRRWVADDAELLSEVGVRAGGRPVVHHGAIAHRAAEVPAVA